MWRTLNRDDGVAVAVNFERVDTLIPVEGGRTTIVFAGGRTLLVRDNFEDLLRALQKW